MEAADPAASGSRKIVYGIEPLTACIFEIKGLARVHWDEVASFQDVRKFSVDWELYLQIERMQRLVLATVRDQGRLIGYVAMVGRPDPHAKASIGAESAFYYVEKRPMRGLIQRNLIRFVVGYLRQKGVHFIRFRNKMDHSNAAILRNIGFEADEMLYILKTGA